MQLVDQLGTKREPDHRPPGRWRAALSVLRGERLVPLQIEVEWLEYQQIFTDILSRFGAQLARDAKAEKKRIEVALDGPQHHPEGSSQGMSKQQLRSKVARERGVPQVMASIGVDVDPGPPNGDVAS